MIASDFYLEGHEEHEEHEGLFFVLCDLRVLRG